MELGLVGFGVLLLVIFLGAPLGFSMVGVAFAGFAAVRGMSPALEMIGQTIVSNSMSYSYTVVPLFVLMGTLIYKADLSSDIYRAAYAWLGHRRGGLALATIAACGGFSAVSGSSVATAATMGRVAYPEMIKYGYKPSMAAGTIAAGGTIGILIPPSVVLVLYGILTDGDIGALFIAGIIPGLLSIVVYMVVISILVRLKPELGPAGQRTDLRGRLLAIRNIWAVAVLFVFIIGGIYFGIFTPTEAGGMGAAGALSFCILRGKMSPSIFFSALQSSARMSAMLFTVALGALCFSNFIEVSGLPAAAIEFVEYMGLPPMGALLMILACYLILGCVFDGPAMVLLTVPLFAPVVASLGFDLIWFGIVVVIATEISMVTPPIGMNAFVLKGVLPSDVTLADIFRGITPYWFADILRLALIVAFPAIVLFLPQLMG